MKTLFDYLKFYKDATFDVFSFNEIDALILSMLSYAKLERIVPKDKRESVSIHEACQKFLHLYSEKDFKTEYWMFPSSFRLMKELLDSKRFYYAKIYYLSAATDSKGQFKAITIRLPNGITFISYEGTDSSVVGWKEDFELMYKRPISSQKMAVAYLDNTLNIFDREIYIGGHSKGGNLAMYAYMYGKSYYKKRVKKVYNFDGPGFLDDVLDTDLYHDLSTKLEMVVPYESVVGMMLGHGSYRVVHSTNKAMMQHDATSWECFGGYFVTTDSLSKKSLKFERNLNDYVKSMTLEERKNFVDTVFAVFEKSHITNIMQLKDFKISSLLSIMKEITNIPSSTKRNLIAVLRMIITSMN